MASATELQHDYEPIFIGRQPIFDRHNAVWGYELLFRHSGSAGNAAITDPDLATSKVVADGISLARSGLGEHKQFLINFPAKLLRGDAPYVMPKDSCIVEILETVIPDPEILQALQAIKAAGYRLALDDYIGTPGFEPFLQLADIIKVEVLGMPVAKLKATVNDLAAYGGVLLAEKIEDAATLELTKSLGFKLFQGFYFSKPEIIPGRKISSSASTKMQLMQTLSQPELDFDALAAIISRDTSISYRLLRYINSAGFGVRHKIQSINQAIVQLGAKRTRQWLMVVILADIDPSPKAEELCRSSVHRARFLEQLTQVASPLSMALSPDSMFMLGLFSRLDALLGMTMTEILADMPVDERLRAALLGEADPVHQWLELCRVLEAGHWALAKNYLKRLHVPEESAAVSFAQASVWANAVMTGSTST